MKLDPAAFVADPLLLQALTTHGQHSFCDQDRVLFRQGAAPDGIYLLESGEATLTVTSLTGEEMMSIKVQTGALLGLPGTISCQPYSLTATALAGAGVRYIAGDEFTALMTSNPQLSLKVLEVLAAEVRTARGAAFNN